MANEQDGLGAAVKEIAALAERSNNVRVDHVSIVDPFTGRSLSFPLAFHGVRQLDLSAELDHWRVAPSRRVGMALANTLQSFIDLTNRHKDKDSAIFGDLVGEKPALLCVVDYHTIEHAPRFGQHHIRYNFPLSEEWKWWKKISGVGMSQASFAQVIEDRLHEFSNAEANEMTEYEGLLSLKFGSPHEFSNAEANEMTEYEGLLSLKFGSPHELVRVARGISLHAELKVDNIVTLASGEAQIGFAEAHNVKGSDGKPLKVPGLVMLSIPLFYGGGLVRVPVGLRYERRGSEVQWKLLLFRADKIELTALTTAFEEAMTLTGLPGFLGSPEA